MPKLGKEQDPRKKLTRHYLHSVLLRSLLFSQIIMQDNAFAYLLHLLSQFYSIKIDMTIGKLALNPLEWQALGKA